MEVNRCFGCMEETLTYPCPHCGYDPKKQTERDYALRPGTILNGKYLVGSVLGQGGFGITYICFDLALEQKVAVKEYFPSAHVTRHNSAGNGLHWYITEQAKIAQSSGLEMFLKEARKMTRVATIPQVVQVRDLFQENGTAYIVMDFIEGETLMRRLKRTGSLTWEKTEQLLLPVIEAMEQVHKAGLIHRDLSPDNLMLQKDGSVKILDLGAAKDLNINSGASSMQVAKSGFSPLEQYVQRGGSGTWTDVYAIAATMYFTLTGVLPPSAIDRMENDTLRWDIPRLLSLPPNVLQAMKKAMALRHTDRTQTMAELAASIRSNTARAEPRSGVPNKRWGKPIIWVVAAILAIILGISIFRSNQDEPVSIRDNTPSSPAQVAYTMPKETEPAPIIESQNTQPAVIETQSAQPTVPKGYLAYVDGSWENHTIHDGSFTLNTYSFVFSQKLQQCRELTVNLDVSMKAGTKCKNWQLWCRIDGQYKKIAKIDLPDGDGRTSQTITFDDPLTFDAVIITPTVIGSYSWSLGFTLTDVWVAE